MAITVGELIEKLKLEPQDADLYFGGLEFYRLKQRGEKLVQVEFSQQVYVKDGSEVVIDNLDVKPHVPKP